MEDHDGEDAAKIAGTRDDLSFRLVSIWRVISLSK
jgi:hypothetical protein